MKRTLNTFMLLVLALGLFNASSPELTSPKAKIAILKFKTEVIDYGTVLQNSDGTRIFNFTNEGDAPLIINKVKTTCGCTVPSYSKSPILPGETGEIQIKYSTRKLGAFTKTVTVMSNAEGGNKILKIKGNIIKAK